MTLADAKLERQVAGRWILSPQLPAVVDELSEVMAHPLPTAAVVAVGAIKAAGDVVSPEGVAEQLVAQGVAAPAEASERVLELTRSAWSSLPEKRFSLAVERLTDLWRRRQLHHQATELQSHALSGDDDGFEQSLRDIIRTQSQVSPAVAPTMRTLRQIAIERLHHLDRICKGEEVERKLSTRVGVLDKRLGGGLRGSQLVVICGRPGMGKSALVLKLLESAANAGEPAAVFSLEMAGREWFDRFCQYLGSVDSEWFHDPKSSRDGWEGVAKAANIIKDWPVWIDDQPSMRMADIRARSRWLKAKSGLGLIVLDYLQLLRAEGVAHREQEVAGYSRDLKQLAKELDVPVVALVQLNRDCEKRPDKRPQLSDLRESGAIEQDADSIIAIYRDAVYNPAADEREAELIVRKARKGKVGTVHVQWHGSRYMFHDITEHDDDLSRVLSEGR